MCGCSLRTPIYQYMCGKGFLSSNTKFTVSNRNQPLMTKQRFSFFPDYANLKNICLEEVSSSTSSHTNAIFKKDFLVYNLQDGFLTV